MNSVNDLYPLQKKIGIKTQKNFLILEKKLYLCEEKQLLK
ncbi:hypothetical protein CAPGI0001_1224 [Capnocytophaga gingivalis ATCC 33624]|nr:hypothetical protein CAPGI0001_1224 [Capnocytophaga gingivalis ATCC 33624]